MLSSHRSGVVSCGVSVRSNHFGADQPAPGWSGCTFTLANRAPSRPSTSPFGGKRANADQQSVARRYPEVISVGDVAAVVGRQQEMLPALAGVGAGYAHVGDPTLIDVHGDDDERAGRKLDDERAGAEVELDRAVRRVGVVREAHMPRLAVENAEDLVVDDSDVGVPAEDGGARHRRIEEPIGLNGAVQVGFVVASLTLILRRESQRRPLRDRGACCPRRPGGRFRCHGSARIGLGEEGSADARQGSAGEELDQRHREIRPRRVYSSRQSVSRRSGTPGFPSSRSRAPHPVGPLSLPTGECRAPCPP